MMQTLPAVLRVASSSKVHALHAVSSSMSYSANLVCNICCVYNMDVAGVFGPVQARLPLSHALRCTGGSQQEADSDQEGAAAARRGASRLRQGHLAFAPVLRPELAAAVAANGAAANGAAANGVSDAQERKRDADGNVKVTGGVDNACENRLGCENRTAPAQL